MESIKSGETTRERVLLMLGEPDAAAPDDSWLSYRSVFGTGGLMGYGLITVSGPTDTGPLFAEEVELRQLMLSFDSSGIVTTKDFQSRTCRATHNSRSSGVCLRQGEKAVKAKGSFR